MDSVARALLLREALSTTRWKVNLPGQFLLTRYTMDEERAQVYRGLAEDVRRMYGSAVPPTEGQAGIADTAYVALRRTADRIVADTSAKRSIVEHLSGIGGPVADQVLWMLCEQYAGDPDRPVREAHV